ncbi:signal recognition particle receptor subunit beta [Chaetomidium leptoderma]|uniref:Signal recognition particle receptor subunit beta n=1 Tax=Chaetomidium leptoderma TaxID=669021 RepID=A0AAN6ZX57_9PEZI|nr:signal recognition particle receptor subunit beta [Chaetomidium leptoderma]
MATLETLKSALEASLTPTPTVISIGLAIVLIIPIILHFIFSATTPYTTLPSVLLLGPSGAGKTALLTLFERGPLSQQDQSTAAVAQTHTSQVPSTVELAVSTDTPSSSNNNNSYRTDLDATGATAKKFLLIDTPGHPKLRGHALSHLASSTITPSSVASASPSAETHKSKLKALIFTVDAASLAADDDNSSSTLSTTAEYLYDVLITLQKRFHKRSGSRAPASVPVLVAANKLDLFTALPAALVKSRLEAELGRIRQTRSKGLLDSGVGVDVGAGGAGEEEGEGWLGGYGNDKFSFKEMMEFDIEVEVLGGNVIGEGPGADRWWKWIGERV